MAAPRSIHGARASSLVLRAGVASTGASVVLTGANGPRSSLSVWAGTSGHVYNYLGETTNLFEM